MAFINSFSTATRQSLILGTAWLLGSQGLHAESTPTKPNIVFIFADDYGYCDMGAYGNREVKTPNLDRLAARGVQFERAYNMGSYSAAVCIASRTMLNTGLTLWQAEHATQRRTNQGPESVPFWSELLEQGGYTTYFTGKWHVSGIGPKEVFEHVVREQPGMPSVHPGNKPHAYDRPKEGQPDTWNPANPAEGGHWKGGKHWSEVLADDAIQLIGQASERDEPFFMYLALNSPHDPRQSPQAYLDLYDADALEVPANFLPVYPHNQAMQAPHGLRDEFIMPSPRTPRAVRVHRKEYYAIITHMDAQIGRILDALEAAGLSDSTVVCFTADHGLAVGQHGLAGKQNMYEHSLRPPFILAGPGIPRGEVRKAPIYLQDIMPTSLELAGVKIPEQVGFKSVMPIVRGDDRSRYPAVYGAYFNAQRAVVDGDHKLIVYPSAKVIRLFNLAEDPLEMNDLARRPESKPVIRRLLARLGELQKEHGDTLSLKDLGEAL